MSPEEEQGVFISNKELYASLKSTDAKVAAINTKVDSVLLMTGQLQDHERRLRFVEKSLWTGAGTAAAITLVLGAIKLFGG